MHESKLLERSTDISGELDAMKAQYQNSTKLPEPPPGLSPAQEAEWKRQWQTQAQKAQRLPPPPGSERKPFVPSKSRATLLGSEAARQAQAAVSAVPVDVDDATSHSIRKQVADTCTEFMLMQRAVGLEDFNMPKVHAHANTCAPAHLPAVSTISHGRLWHAHCCSRLSWRS